MDETNAAPVINALRINASQCIILPQWVSDLKRGRYSSCLLPHPPPPPPLMQWQNEHLTEVKPIPTCSHRPIQIAAATHEVNSRPDLLRLAERPSASHETGLNVSQEYGTSDATQIPRNIQIPSLSFYPRWWVRPLIVTLFRRQSYNRTG